jgi:predicted O-methyltransferase YrrM
MWSEIADRKGLLLSDVPELPFHLSTLPAGWLAPVEASLLYMAGLQLDGPFLEVGSWVGRSTICLAKGIQHRPEGRKTQFDTVDLGIASVAEWRRWLHTDPLMRQDIETLLPSIYLPGGAIAALIANLKQHDVLEHVTTIMRGNFLTIPIAREYGVIFCDTLHDDNEIALYAPKLSKLLAPGGWIFCDDIIDERRAETIKTMLDLEFYALTNPISQYTKFLIGRRK